ncbi:MAG: GatB/YqeY domain-containing protein [Anaerolineae bacterium]|nr:GatB/YqeY domain-containing protein [Anaerolineae bacterium]
MAFREQLQQDLKDAMRARDEHRKLALRMVLTAIQLAEVEKKETLTDDEMLEVLRKEVSRREDALEMVRQAGRDDLVEEDVIELEILRAYLPKMMDEAEITTLAQAAIVAVGASSPSDVGKVMQALMPQVRGKADGRLVNQTVRKLLSA